jgi:aryl-alcohol dehydrogenase-like predicted oxidoreductase
MQNHLNLLYREEENEMLPFCREEGVGVIPWSPLARGKLARPWSEQGGTKRAETDQFTKKLYKPGDEADRAIIEAVGRVASGRGVPMAQVAMAWLLAKPGVTAPIIGASKAHHLDDAIAAVSLKLTEEEISVLEAPYIPRQAGGFG